MSKPFVHFSLPDNYVTFHIPNKLFDIETPTAGSSNFTKTSFRGHDKKNYVDTEKQILTQVKENQFEKSLQSWNKELKYWC